jgi:hypothetical protein
MHSRTILLALNLGLFSSTHAGFCIPPIPNLPGAPAINPIYETVPGVPLCSPGESSTPDGTVPEAVPSQPAGGSAFSDPPAAPPQRYQFTAQTNNSDLHNGIGQGGSGSGTQPAGGSGSVPAGGSNSVQLLAKGDGASLSSSFSTSYTSSSSQMAVPSGGAAGGAAEWSNPGNRQSFKATITTYGANIGITSTDGNCNVANSDACGWNVASGYTAAASEALYNSPGSGVIGKACGSCWYITGTMDGNGNPVNTTPIVVTINNECPAQGNTLCAQSSLSDTNKFGAAVNIDLCSDSDAQLAFFGTQRGGFAQGTATSVPCSEWKGTNGSLASW